ncbi:MAG: hypothetical protein E6G51_04990 [Actinobacteria bacterium]|nr:MAG: hypothetical protein E6G51_04990 [Actinomycetota bacterium]
MSTQTPLVGRAEELARLNEAVERAQEGHGSLLLLAGEAGVGKSRLAQEAASGAEVVLYGAASNGATVAYGPIVAALRSRLRADPDALADCGSLVSHLALLLPELGKAADESERATIFEAVRCAFAHLSAEQPAVVVLDDLQWSDDTTLELLAALAAPLREMPVLVLGTYRSDGLPREHRLRWLRNELRRAGLLEELALEPLDQAGVEALLGELLPEAPSPTLTRTVYDRTLGSPFFVEELVTALQARGSLRSGRVGLELVERDEIPVPDSVREAVLVGIGEVSAEGREAAEAAAVLGPQFDLGLAAELTPAAGLAELIEIGLLEERAAGTAAFRHALAQEALYAEVPWARRRDLHRRLAHSLEQTGGSSLEVATHWRGAGEEPRAREALVEAARASEAVCAHRDTLRAAREGLELWPEDEAEELRLETLAGLRAQGGQSGIRGSAAPAGRDLRARRRARQGLCRPAPRRRGVRGSRATGRGGAGAAGDGRPPPARRSLRRGDRARQAGRRRGQAGRAGRHRRPHPRPPGRGRGQGR